ncbi:DUF6709 family protein [Dielma fastidiosa]|uniref:DUF6709 family protein n=1 Tax=Dielma fastidiosa TaxID=1034346 RepID=UPI000E51C6B0|nr:DUF6709 family protein [Dielma fastidiosa]RHN01371.1 hypothetical protein DWZ33_05100 [Dielma fastidiosa]
MNMLKELKKVSLKKVLPLLLICFVVGLVLLGIGAPSAITVLSGGTDINRVPVNELEGKYVSAEITFIMNSYAYTERRSSGKSKVTAKEYIIPVGQAEYMGIEVPAKFVDQADALLRATNDYIINENEFTGESFTIHGTVKAMSSQSKKYYHEVVGYDEMTLETQKLMLPLVLEEGQVGDKSQTEVWMYTGGGLLLTALGLFFLIRVMSGSYQKSITQYCAAQLDADSALAKVEDFYQMADQVSGIRMDRNFMMFQVGAKTWLLPASSVVWAYQQTTQHRTNGIPTGKSYSLMICQENGKQIALGMKEKQAQEVLAAFIEHYPRMFIGYSQERANMYKKDRETFCKAAHELGA